MEALRNTDDDAGMITPFGNPAYHHTPNTSIDTHNENIRALKQLCRDHLRHNVKIATEFQKSQEVIAAINAPLPYLFITKCVDGRVHGTRSKGLPPISHKTKIRRSDGNRFITDAKNGHFWETVHELAIEAHYRSPKMPVVAISLGHFSGTSNDLGCAAHHEESDKALKCVKDQAMALQKSAAGNIIPVYGMTDTDNLLHHLWLLDEKNSDIDPAQMIHDLNLKTPMDLFTSEFLEKPATEIGIRNMNGEKIGDLLQGDILPFFHDISTSLHLQQFLLETFAKELPDNENTIVNPNLLHAFRKKFTELDNAIPAILHPFFIYMLVWNMGYGLYKNQRLATMPDKEKKAYLGHSEKLICYGEGFQTLGRNDALLVKPGRMDISIPLAVTSKVINSVRTMYPQPFPPVVHINFELDHAPNTPEIPKILAVLTTRINQVIEVFGENVRIFTTYSIEDEKCFYPVKTSDDGTTSIDLEWNVLEGITPTSNEKKLRQAEKKYRADIMAR